MNVTNEFTNLVINHYCNDNREEYKSMLKKKRLHREMRTLNIQTFLNGKHIYLLSKRGFLNKEKIIGYAIIHNIDEIDEDNMEYLPTYFSLNSSAIDDCTQIIIADFMIHPYYRNNGVGKWYYNSLIHNFYKDSNAILNADGDGALFWPKNGFHIFDEDKKTMKNY